MPTMMVTRSISFPPALAEELDNMMAALLQGNRSLVVTQAVQDLILRMRKTHNNGKPFTTPAPVPGRRNRRQPPSR